MENMAEVIRYAHCRAVQMCTPFVYPNTSMTLHDVHRASGVLDRAQLSASAGKKVVGALAALDRQLESVGILYELTPQPVPEDVADEDGQMHNDRVEVRASFPAASNELALYIRFTYISPVGS